MSSLVIIVGPSGCGKTTLAKHIAHHINMNNHNSSINISQKKSQEPIVLHQDHYFTKPFLPYRDRIDDSYENDSGINWIQLQHDIMMKKGCCCCTGKSITVDSSNSYSSNNNGDEQIDNNDDKEIVLIVEGHLLSSSLLTSYNIQNHNQSIFKSYSNIIILLLSCQKEICLDRRLNRNSKRSIEEYNELKSYYEQYVWKSYMKFGKDAKQSFRDWLLTLGNENDNKVSIREFDNDHDESKLLDVAQSIVNELYK